MTSRLSSPSALVALAEAREPRTSITGLVWTPEAAFAVGITQANSQTVSRTVELDFPALAAWGALINAAFQELEITTIVVDADAGPGGDGGTNGADPAAALDAFRAAGEEALEIALKAPLRVPLLRDPEGDILIERGHAKFQGTSAADPRGAGRSFFIAPRLLKAGTRFPLEGRRGGRTPALPDQGWFLGTRSIDISFRFPDMSGHQRARWERRRAELLASDAPLERP